MRVETTFALPDWPEDVVVEDFEQIYSYNSEAPYFWEANVFEVQSPFFGDGSPALAIEFFSGTLEQGLQVVLPNTYLRSNTVFYLNSEPPLPADGVAGVDWSFWFSEAVPMSAHGRVSYDPSNNTAHVTVTFTAGITPTPVEQIAELIEFVESSPDIDRHFSERLAKKLGNILRAVKTGKPIVAEADLRALSKQIESAQTSKRGLISEGAAEYVSYAIRQIALTFD